MTLNGAIKQLHDMRCADDIPMYYRPAIAEVINVLLMDTEEVRHGQWIVTGFMEVKCSLCGAIQHELADANYCPNCGAKMDEVEE